MEPTFIVGTEQEIGLLKHMGFKAATVEDDNPDALAVRLAGLGSTAIITTDAWAADDMEAACIAAGTAYKVLPEWVFADEMELAFGDAKQSTEGQEALFEICTKERDEAVRRYEADRAQAAERLLEKLGVHDVTDVALEISTGGADRERIPTGLANLDAIMGGGLPMGGLVTLGAVSSTGKTTLCLQVADHIAASGRPVLFVTVEQGRHELVAKSISRIMRKLPTRNGGWYSASSADIRSAAARESWGEPMVKAFSTACAEYARTIAPNLRIMEVDRQPSTADIRKAVECMAAQRGTAPIVFVDYLQLLKPANDRMTERQAVDGNVTDLRQNIAREYGTCVVLISSLNRASYSEGVNLEAFKESGSIEYSSDVLLGLQPLRMEDELAAVKESEQKRKSREIMGAYKSKSVRDTEVKVLKNREGAVPREGARLTYHAISNLFEDAGSAGNDERDQLPRL